jgi:peroxiredoxin
MGARLAAALVVLATASSTPTSSIPALAVRPVSDAAKLPLEAGRGRPAVLHFWATWCDACKEEFPRLRKLFGQLEGRGVGMLLVSIDKPEDLEKVKRDLRKFGLQGIPSVVLDAPDPEPVVEAVGDKKWDGTLPSTFVFDSAGKLRAGFIGKTRPEALESALRAVR